MYNVKFLQLLNTGFFLPSNPFIPICRSLVLPLPSTYTNLPSMVVCNDLIPSMGSHKVPDPVQCFSRVPLRALCLVLCKVIQVSLPHNYTALASWVKRVRYPILLHLNVQNRAIRSLIPVVARSQRGEPLSSVSFPSFFSIRTATSTGDHAAWPWVVFSHWCLSATIYILWSFFPRGFMIFNCSSSKV